MKACQAKTHIKKPWLLFVVRQLSESWSLTLCEAHDGINQAPVRPTNTGDQHGATVWTAVLCRHGSVPP